MIRNVLCRESCMRCESHKGIANACGQFVLLVLMQANCGKGLVVKAGIVLPLLWKWVWDKKRGCIAGCAMQPLVCYG